MPRITVASGPSNAGARPGEVGYIEPEDARPRANGGVISVNVSGSVDPGPLLTSLHSRMRGEQGPELADLPTGGHVEAVAEDAPVGPVEPAATQGAGPEGLPPAPGPALDYASMTVAQLREAVKALGLPVGGSKTDLVARLAAQRGGDGQ